MIGFDRCLKPDLLLQTRFSLEFLMFGWDSKGRWNSEQVFFPLKVLIIAGIMTFSLEYIKGYFFGRCWWMRNWKWEPLQEWPVHQYRGVLPVSVQWRLWGGSRWENLCGWVLTQKEHPKNVPRDHSENLAVSITTLPSGSLEENKNQSRVTVILP